MELWNRFRDSNLARGLIDQIHRLMDNEISLMEVCGTHTVAIARAGIRGLMPRSLRLLSGPGCPICVTPIEVIDLAVRVAENPDNILMTFGDMMRVPGSESSLERTKAKGADIRIVYSAFDALKVALDNPDKKVIFMGVGFETTSPTIAATVLEAKSQRIKNFFVLPAFKLIPPAMAALVNSGEVRLRGFICPGHVSTIIGSQPYEFIPKEFGIPCVITGFELIDVLQSIVMLLNQIRRGEARVEVEYRRSVRPQGNELAQQILWRVFEKGAAKWRGLGMIPESGLGFREEFMEFDAMEQFNLTPEPKPEPAGCACGEILRGVKIPTECPLFGKACRPESPVGPCMVSSEGACAAYYNYGEW